MPDLEQDPSKRRLFKGTNILGHPTEIGLPGGRDLGDVGLDLSSFAAQPTGPGAGGPGGAGAAPIGARPGEQLSGAGATAMQALGIGTRGLNLLARGVRSFSGGAEPTAGMPQAAIEAGITAEQFSHLTEAFGPMTPWEIQNLTAQDFRNVLGAAQEFGIPLTDAEVARIAEGAVGATSAEEAGALGTGAAEGGAGLGGLGGAGVGAALSALSGLLGGQNPGRALVGAGVSGLAGAGMGPLAMFGSKGLGSMVDAWFGGGQPSGYDYTRQGDALSMSRRFPMAMYGIMSARSPEELTRVLQEQDFARKDQNVNWSEADLINTLRNDPMALNVLTGNYHLDEAGIDQQINQLIKLAALKMRGGDTVNIPGWNEARAMLEKQVFSSPQIGMLWGPEFGGMPTPGGDPWANYSTLAAGPTTWYGDPYQSV